MKPNILALSAIVALAIMLMVPFMAAKTADTNENGELEEKEESSSEEYIDERRFFARGYCELRKDIQNKPIRKNDGKRRKQNRLFIISRVAKTLNVPVSTYVEQPSFSAPQTEAPTTITTTAAPQTTAAPPETTIAQTTIETVPETEAAVVAQTPLYAVNGEVLREDVQVYLYQKLCEHGIGWFFPYSILIAYQESHFDFHAVNPTNGIDMGLFQFRVTYYPGANIFDPFEQINIFAQLMGNRAAAGCDVYTMISRHNTSDYGAYNPQYVAEVMQHEPVLVRIR